MVVFKGDPFSILVRTTSDVNGYQKVTKSFFLGKIFPHLTQGRYVMFPRA